MPGFSKINEWASNFVTWATLFGLLWAGFTWLASKLTPMQGFGFADFLAVGIACALGMTLVIAVFLAAWRYFRPLPHSYTPKGASSSEAELKADVLFDLQPQIMAAIEKAYQGINAELAHQAEQIGKCFTEIQRTDLAAARDAEKYSDAIKRLTEENAARKKDIDLLFRLASAETTVRLCDVILLDFPKYEGRLIDQSADTISSCWESLRDYIDTVKAKTRGTMYETPVTNIIANLERSTGAQVDATPHDKRPVGIDHLLWRKYAITEGQARNLKQYFESQRWQLIETSVAIQRDVTRWIEERVRG